MWRCFSRTRVLPCLSSLGSAQLMLAPSALSQLVSLQLLGIFQLSESMMKVSKFGLSSDTSASTKSSMEGRLCSIPVEQTHKGFEDECPRRKKLHLFCFSKQIPFDCKINEAHDQFLDTGCCSWDLYFDPSSPAMSALWMHLTGAQLLWLWYEPMSAVQHSYEAPNGQKWKIFPPLTEGLLKRATAHTHTRMCWCHGANMTLGMPVSV